MNDIVEREENVLASIEITPMQMISQAIDKGMAVEQLSGLFELQERWEANEAKKAYVKAMGRFKKSQPELYKDKTVKAGAATYSHISLDMAASVIGKALSEFGFYHRWQTKQNEGKTIVSCIVTHEKGHSESSELEADADKSGSKNNVQAIGSTVTYLERYTLLAAVGLAAKGQDDDAMQVTPITEDEFEELQNLISEAGITTQQFCDKFDISSVNSLLGKDYRRAKMLLEQRIRKSDK